MINADRRRWEVASRGASTLILSYRLLITFYVPVVRPPETCSGTMLALLGLITIVTLLVVIMMKWMSPLVALILIPVAAALICGFGWDTGKFIVSGLQSLAPVVGMFVFAILFFGVVTDAGMLDPIIDRILRTVGTKPTRIVMGTTLLALLIHLDGSGAVTFLITIPAMLPLYDKLGIDRRILACAASMAAGVNFLPWTGPMLRASAALKLPIPEIFNPLLPVQIVGLVFIFGVSYWLGRREERRLGIAQARSDANASEQAGSSELHIPKRNLHEVDRKLRRPGKFWINIILTLAVLGTTVAFGDKLAPAIIFMPVTAEVGQQLGVPKLQLAQAALLGQMTTGFPVSPLTPATFLVVGLTGIDLADHRRFTIPFLFGASLVMTVACLVLGVFPL
jgi:Mg2+/citrate symporter